MHLQAVDFYEKNVILFCRGDYEVNPESRLLTHYFVVNCVIKYDMEIKHSP